MSNNSIFESKNDLFSEYSLYRKKKKIIINRR